jgi:hypothetical protein
MSIPYKIIGWVVGWFNKDLGNKITEWADKLDWFKWVGAIFKRIGKIFDIVAKPFVFLYEKGKELIENTVLFGPFKMAWDSLKKVFGVVSNAMKSIGSVISKFFSGMKNFFYGLMDGLRWIGEKISGIPLFKKIGQELKEIAGESQISSMESSPPILEVQKDGLQEFKNTAENQFENLIGDETEMAGTDSWKSILGKEDERTYDAFSDFGDDLTQINQTTGINNKIAVDQLREFKILNQKFDMLMQQLTNGKNVITNVINSNSMNSFPQSTSVFDLRQYHRGGN